MPQPSEFTSPLSSKKPNAIAGLPWLSRLGNLSSLAVFCMNGIWPTIGFGERGSWDSRHGVPRYTDASCGVTQAYRQFYSNGRFGKRIEMGASNLEFVFGLDRAIPFP